jgi:hypothetical protein
MPEVSCYLKAQVSKSLIVKTRCGIRNHVLSQRDPEWQNLNVVHRRNEESPLQWDNRWALDGMFVDGIDHAGIVAGRTN